MELKSPSSSRVTEAKLEASSKVPKTKYACIVEAHESTRQRVEPSLENSNRDECMTETGRAPIPTDWVDINKGDSPRPNYRSRLVCQETRGRSTIDAEDWAATPPYEAFRLQLSLMMTGPRSQVDGDDEVLTLVDISRAHLHSPLARAVFVTIDGKVYKLLKAMY